MWYCEARMFFHRGKVQKMLEQAPRYTPEPMDRGQSWLLRAIPRDLGGPGGTFPSSAATAI